MITINGANLERHQADRSTLFWPNQMEWSQGRNNPALPVAGTLRMPATSRAHSTVQTPKLPLKLPLVDNTVACWSQDLAVTSGKPSSAELETS